ncbi:MAG: hypothetical protein EBY21_14565, partial [Alphaproteobacteria bacterium]|nr:hypothetical protein [Alphaproteobacteria bacterium]
SHRLANIEAAMDGRALKQPASQDPHLAHGFEQAGAQDILANLDSRLQQTEARAPLAARPISAASLSSAGLHPHLAQAIVQIADRQKALEEALAPREESASSKMDGEVKAELARLLKRLEDMRQESQQREELHRLESSQRDLWLEKETQRLEQTRHAIEQTRSVPEFAKIREQLADMTTAIANLAPRDLVMSLDSTLHDLSRRIASPRSHLAGGDSLQSVDHLLGEVRSLLADFAPRSKLDTIQSELRLLTKRFEDVSASQIEGSAIEMMQSQIDDIRQILLRTLDHRQPFEALQTDLNSLTAYIDQFLEEGSGQSKQDVADAVEAIRARLSQSLASPHLLSLEGRLDSVTAKIDSILDMGAGAQRIDDLTRQISQFQDAIIHRLEQTQAPAAQFSGLEVQIERLSEKIDQFANPSNLSPASQANQTLVMEAAQLAAQQVLQEVQGQAAGEIPAPVVQDLNQLRQQHVKDNQLTHETLAAVHETLEKVVDRISHLENELGESPQAAAHGQGHSGRSTKNNADQSGWLHNPSPSDAYDDMDPLARSVDFGHTQKGKSRGKNTRSLTKGLPDIHIEAGSRLD